MATSDSSETKNSQNSSNASLDASTSKWLDAHYDAQSSLTTYAQCIELCDINGDGDYKLVLADLGNNQSNMKLKVFKGTELVNENTIIDLPTGLVSFYIDTNEPFIPAIAVASGPYIYVYKNMRPYFKFCHPSLPVHELEAELWSQAKENAINVYVLRDTLEGLRNEGHLLTTRSLKFCQMGGDDLSEFVQSHSIHPLKRQTVITCITTVKKSLSEEKSLSCLVYGTEERSLHVLDPAAFTILASMTVSSVPSLLSISGLFDVEYRLVVACRNGFVYIFKKGCTEPKYNIELHTHTVGIEKVNKSIVVACMDNTLHGYSAKGMKLWEIQMPGRITIMTAITYKPRNISGVLVALSNKEIHMYRDKNLVDIITLEDNITAMKFGPYGREEGVLIAITTGGGLLVKILRRNVNFEENYSVSKKDVSSSSRLNLPKKTKLYVDQIAREQENAIAMHQKFQNDLYLLKLKTARQYVNVLSSSSNPISNDPNEPIRLSAQVRGLGPTFKLVITVQNTSLNNPSLDLFLSFAYNHNLYAFADSHIGITYMVPGVSYQYETLIECLTTMGLQDNIKVFLSKEGNTTPLLTADISMPVSDLAAVT